MYRYIQSIDGQLIPSRRGDWCRVAEVNARLAEQDAYFNQERWHTTNTHINELNHILNTLQHWKIACAVLAMMLGMTIITLM
jgi:hypothetical protein